MPRRAYSAVMSSAATAPSVAAWRVALGTALAYALVGAAALLLAGPPGYAAPLYPSAGIALASALYFGRAALPGVLLAATLVNYGLGALRGVDPLLNLWLSALIGAGAALQTSVGAALVRRHVAMPLVLNAPRDIQRFALLGALLACTVSPSVATMALLAAGVIDAGGAPETWLTWWAGDSLGVLIAVPLMLTLIGHPEADWRPRRRTLGLPLLLALALLAGGMREMSALDQQRRQVAFDRDADRLVSAAEARLSVPLYALQALHTAARVRAGMDEATLRDTARWWLGLPAAPLLAMGYSERVALEDLPDYEARVREAGRPGYRVFDRDNGSARRTDGEVLALRLIEPAEGNRAALGVNALSIPAARQALLTTRASGEPAVTRGFKLTQAEGDETGVVIYQALFDTPTPTPTPADPAAAGTATPSLRAVVFITVPTERALAGLSEGLPHLRWCLLDPDPGATRPRLAGTVGCETDAAETGDEPAWKTRRALVLAGHALELRISDTNATAVRGDGGRVLQLVGLAAAALLGSLLLAVTGQARRTELAVAAATTELRHEIAERNAAEQALRDSEARLRNIVDHVPLGVMFLDPQGQLIDGNPRLAGMLGRSVEQLRGQPVLDFVHPDDRARALDLRLDLLHGAALSGAEPLRVVQPDGCELLTRVSASALRDDDGRVLRLVGVVEDITEHMRLLDSERALQRAEAANRAKSDFLSRMSHELRTPLNAMIGFAQLLGLNESPRLAPQQAEWTQQIQRAGWHLLEMINETLDLARIEGGAVQLSLQPVALQPLLSACCAMVATPAAQQDIHLTVDAAPDAGAVLADPLRARQVLTNLLSNAVKYNKPGGRVDVQTRRLPGADGGDRIEISVRDTGLGMTPSQHAALFQPYNRLGRELSTIEGTGIGLVISRRLTEMMGGTLEARSTDAVGSVFTLCLPAARLDEAADDTAGTGAAPASYHRRHVHYVEDNETNVEVMRGIFAQRPQVTLTVSMLGLDGLTVIRDTHPDLVLLDMHLPDISGLELLRHLKRDERLADIPVVVVSADATPLQTEQALIAGALRYLTKPVDVSGLLQVVDEVLEAADTRFG